MTTKTALLMLAALGVVSGNAAAQTQSFDELSASVRPGTAVDLRLDDGRKTSGKVVSITGDRIEIRRRRWFRTEQLSFPEASVRRIEERDSTVNGELLGFAAGVLAARIRCVGIRTEMDAWSCLGWSVIAPAVGLVSGGAIDGAIRRPLYVATGSRVQLRPLRGGGVGVTASIGF
jgi:hypothetical protein